MDDSSHVKPTKMKGTEEVMIFLCICIRWWSWALAVVLLGSWALDYQHVIVHHLGAPRTEAHSGVDELRVLMRFGFWCLFRDQLGLRWEGVKLNGHSPSSWPLAARCSYCADAGLSPRVWQSTKESSAGTPHGREGGAVVGTAWPALAARPSRTLVTPLAPPASAPFSIEITTVPTTQACCES